MTGPKESVAGSKQHEALFAELMAECKHSAPGARLSAKLRTQLERLPPEERRAVVSRTWDGCAPLFVAARRGNAELVEYLVHVCAAELEQRGVYEVPDERSVHTVTPLWCAAVAGMLEVVRVLCEAGADVDAASDSGSTPVRSACFMTHLDVVRYLVSRGADVQRPNHNGGTCLINAVQSARLCALLLHHGANVDAQDMQLKTALHYAIQEHRVETARLLLQHGADPMLTSRAGDDALRTAALKGAASIMSVLLSSGRYSASRAADAYELLGATLLDEFNDPGAALAAWRKATALRHTPHGYVEKEGSPLPAGGAEALGCGAGAGEWGSMEELEGLGTDMDLLRAAALRVAVRVLGHAHKDTLYRLMYRGAAYADACRYQRCVDLWAWALDIRIEKDTLLYTDTCHTACALTRLMLDGYCSRLERGGGGGGAGVVGQGVVGQGQEAWPRHGDVARVLRAVGGALGGAREALRPAPRHKKQADTFDRALRCLTHLIYLLHRTAHTEEQVAGVKAAVRWAVRLELRSAHTGDSLLHLTVSRLNVIKSTFFEDHLAEPQTVFPCVSTARLLLQCGADPRLRNSARSTPLHVAAIPYNFSTELIQVLLAGGAHLDTPNKFGDSAVSLVALHRPHALRPLQHLSLRCLAAGALLAAGLAPPTTDTTIPRTLHHFIDLHRP